MKSQRFVANSVREALNKVKDSLGEEAIILSNRRISGGKVEIIARLNETLEEADSNEMVENPMPVISATQSDRAIQAIPAQRRNTKPGLDLSEAQTSQLIRSLTTKPAVNNMPNTINASADLVSREGLRAEIDELKSMLHEHFKENKPTKQATDISELKVNQLLVRLGFDSALAKRWASKITFKLNQSQNVDFNSGNQWVKAAFKQLFNVFNHQLTITDHALVDKPGIYALVGPTGAGKTTSLAKIAAKFVMKNNPQEIGLITTDSHRIGAKAQMQALGEALNIQVQCVSLDHEVVSALDVFKHKKMILIDTAGFTFRNTQRHQQLLSLTTLCPKIKPLLVIPATHQANVQRKLYEALAPLRFAGAIITKCDEAMAIGQSLSLVISRKIPLSYLCNGQTIPDDIHYFTTKSLVAFMGRLYGETLEPSNVHDNNLNTG